MKTIKFYTLGCKVNQYDTQLIREQFINSGFKELNNGLPADICIINTCTVTHRADSDSLNIIRRAIRQNPDSKIIVTGCLTEMDADKIKAIKGVSLVVKNSDKENIIRHIRQVNKSVKNVKKTISYFEGRSRAFIKIQDGCSNFCSYCKVPLVRGYSRSRPIEEIIQEATNLAKNGFKEIVLCGICLGAYGGGLKPKADIVDVIERLENITGLLRIRLSSIEVKDVTDRLIAKLASSKKLCRHLHIPLQSGDDSILKKMNRAYSGKDYLDLIGRIKSSIPKIAITTDVMVGFPEESEDNFQNTVRLIKKILPLKVHIFAYSRREGTQACAKFKQGLEPKIIKERSIYLKKVAESCSLDYKKRFISRIMPVLIEDKSESGLWQGYTDNYIRVSFKSDLKIQNALIQVKLKKIIKDYVFVQQNDPILKRRNS
jgi:threonylcarbamoyladenosine tRNA methylthiotransferase MtaB